MTHDLKILHIPKSSTEVVSQQHNREFVLAEVLSDSPSTQNDYPCKNTAPTPPSLPSYRKKYTLFSVGLHNGLLPELHPMSLCSLHLPRTSTNLNCVLFPVQAPPFLFLWPSLHTVCPFHLLSGPHYH